MRSVKNLVILIIIISLSTDMSFARGKISGVVLDAETKQPVVGVSVSLDDDYMGTKTDSLGKFRLINIPEKYHSLTFVSYEYENFTVDSVLFEPNENKEIDTFYLERDMDGIEVIEKRVILDRFGGGWENITLGREKTVDESLVTTKEQLLELISKIVIDSDTVNKGKNTLSDITTVDELLGDTSLGVGACGDFKIGYITYPYIINGHVLSAEDSLPIAEAIIINGNPAITTSSWWAGTITDSTGHFKITKLRRNSLIDIKIFSPDYRLLYDTISIDSTNVLDTFYLARETNKKLDNPNIHFRIKKGIVLSERDSTGLSTQVIVSGISPIEWSFKVESNSDGFFSYPISTTGTYSFVFIESDFRYVDTLIITDSSFDKIDTFYLNEIRGQ